MRVAVVGGECTGKSTLARGVAAHLGAPIATEALRDFVATSGRPPRAREQRAIMRAQLARELAHSAEPHLICDPATLMTAVYSQVYFDDHSLDTEAVLHARSYDLLLWCRPDFPWVAEAGQHDGPMMRSLADERIDTLIRTHRLPAVEIVGPMEQRLTMALHEVALPPT